MTAAALACGVAAQTATITQAVVGGGSSVQISVTVAGAPDGLEFSEAQFKDAQGNTLASTTLTDIYNNGPHVIQPNMPTGAAKVRIKHSNGTSAWFDIAPPPN